MEKLKPFLDTKQPSYRREDALKAYAYGARFLSKEEALEIATTLRGTYFFRDDNDDSDNLKSYDALMKQKGNEIATEEMEKITRAILTLTTEDDHDWNLRLTLYIPLLKPYVAAESLIPLKDLSLTESDEELRAALILAMQ